mgnify:FL=1
MHKNIRHNDSIPWKRFFIMSICIVAFLSISSHATTIVGYFHIFEDIDDVYIKKLFELFSIIIATIIGWIATTV